MSDHYPNSGVLFKNDKKEGNPKFPDYNGNCEINGKQFWISAWIKTGRSGSKFMSLAFKPKEPLGQAVSKAAPPSAPASPAPEEEQDDVPFNSIPRERVSRWITGTGVRMA